MLKVYQGHRQEPHDHQEIHHHGDRLRIQEIGHDQEVADTTQHHDVTQGARFEEFETEQHDQEGDGGPPARGHTEADQNAAGQEQGAQDAQPTRWQAPVPMIVHQASKTQT